MICKSCGAIIKHSEEYCRKCGALVINFKQFENKDLKNLCIENTMKNMSKYLSDSKAQLKKISNQDINKSSNKFNIGDVVDIILDLLKI